MMAVLGKEGKRAKKHCQHFLLKRMSDTTEPSTRETARELLHREMQVDGFDAPTWVVKYTEAIDLLDLMPTTHVRAMRKRVREVFQKQFDSAEMVRQAAEIGRQQELGQRARAGYVFAMHSERNGLRIGTSFAQNPIKRVAIINESTEDPYILTDFIRCGNPDELERFLRDQLREWCFDSSTLGSFMLSPVAASVIFDCVRRAIEEMGCSEDDSVDTAVLHSKVRFTFSDLYRFQLG